MRILTLWKVKGLPEVTELGNQVITLPAQGLSLRPAGLGSEDLFLKPALEAAARLPT